MPRVKFQYYEDYAQHIISKHLKLLQALHLQVKENKDIEAIHQWRVTSRRLRDALKVFKDLFPPQKLKDWNRQIRKTAEVAGKGRDLDIHIRFLKNLSTISGSQKITAFLVIEREELQPAINRAMDDLAETGTLEELEKFMQQLVRLTKKQPMTKLLSVARKRISQRLIKLISYEKFVGYPQKKKELHQMRIAAKHLRYCLESFEGFYGIKMRFFINSVMSVQEILGDVHDYDVWLEMLPQYLKEHSRDDEMKTAVQSLLKHCSLERDKAYHEFTAVWKQLKQKKVWDLLTKFIFVEV